MTARQLDGLPAETLSAICECVGLSHPRSVLSFALVNKHFYSVASAFLYRSIAFKAGSPEERAQDAQRCEHLLRRDSAFQHVRRFVVYPRHGHPLDFARESSDPLKWQRMPFEKLIGSPFVGHEQAMRAFMDSLSWGHPNLTPAQEAYQYDASWKPLSRLVKLLPALTDFVFACSDQLPPCILETLHKHFTGSTPNRLRLHVCNFMLHSLADAEFDPHEEALASSPLLHGIWVHYQDTNGYDWLKRPNYHGDAVVDLVAGFAPNLQEVRLFHRYGNETDEDSNYRPPPPAWKGFPKCISNKGEEAQQSLGSLQYLELGGIDEYDSANFSSRRHLSKDVIQRWKSCTDFSVLCTLKLCQIVLREALVFLVDCCSFPNLTSLTLEYENYTSLGDVELLQKFLCSLPNLRSLELPFEGSLQHLSVTAFNPRLTRLQLSDWPGTLNYKELSSIVQRCPLLEHLLVTLPRYRGGAPEVAIYRLIGSLPQLRRLELMLDAGSTTPEARAFVP